MNLYMIDIMFFLLSVYIFIKLVFYSMYEIKIERNNFGGISTIIITLISIVFSNFIVWKN